MMNWASSALLINPNYLKFCINLITRKKEDEIILTTISMKAPTLSQFTITNTLTAAVIFAATPTYYLPTEQLVINE